MITFTGGAFAVGFKYIEREGLWVPKPSPSLSVVQGRPDQDGRLWRPFSTILRTNSGLWTVYTGKSITLMKSSGQERYIFQDSSTKLGGWENVNVLVENTRYILSEWLGGNRQLDGNVWVSRLCERVWYGTRCISCLRRPRLYPRLLRYSACVNSFTTQFELLKEHIRRILRARLNGKARLVCKRWLIMSVKGTDVRLRTPWRRGRRERRKIWMSSLI